MKKLILISALLLFASNGWAEEKSTLEKLPETHKYSCDFEDIKMHVSYDQNFENTNTLGLLDLNYNMVGVLEVIRKGKVTFVHPDGDLEEHMLVVTHGQHGSEFLKAFFLTDKYGRGDIHMLTIKSWDDGESSYSKTTYLHGIQTYEGNCKVLD